MSIDKISIVMIAKDAEETIDTSLNALQSFNDVVLYLNGSSDATENIAQQYDNVTIVKGDFIGFGNTKNAALEHSRHDWILSLDSDEILNTKLVSEINDLDLIDDTVVYELIRDNYFLGAKTQSSDVIVRIFNKKYTKFNNSNVHEKVIVPSDAKKVRLKTHFTHLNITNINQTLTKIIKYTDLGAKDKHTCLFIIVIFKALFAFFKTYILQANILKGWVGFALAINSANKRYYKYLKQFINCKTKRKKL